MAGHGLSNSSFVISSMKDESVVVTLVLRVSLSTELVLPGDARGGPLLLPTRGVLSLAACCCSISLLFMVDVDGCCFDGSIISLLCNMNLNMQNVNQLRNRAYTSISSEYAPSCTSINVVRMMMNKWWLVMVPPSKE